MSGPARDYLGGMLDLGVHHGDNLIDVFVDRVELAAL